MRREGITDEIMQHIIDALREGYEEYKRNHPDVAKVLEDQCEGKTDAEFEAQFNQVHNTVVYSKNTTCPHCGEYNFRDEIINGCCHECHGSLNCESCGEALHSDICSCCGRINK